MRSNARQTFDSLDELIQYVKANPEKTAKKTPFVVISPDGDRKWILAGNSDQAIAGTARTDGYVVESIPITAMMVS